MAMHNAFHYPPELLNLLIETIPLLVRSKADVLLFFRGSGVSKDLVKDLEMKVRCNKDSINKFDIARAVLTRLNEQGDRTLRERREVLKRVVEFEEFSTCWPQDRLKAKGLVAEIRHVINIKDSFTRMKIERERELEEHRKQKRDELELARQRRDEISKIRGDFFSLFGEKDAAKRGKRLEELLNRLFAAYGILVREAFTVNGNEREGVIEQIDGVIELDSHTYLVEMKWMKECLGPDHVAPHMVRVFGRHHSRGIFVSASGYTKAAVAICREHAQRGLFVLCELQEIVHLLEREGDLVKFLQAKIRAATIDKNPLFQPPIDDLH